jgi:hypothetical protein
MTRVSLANVRLTNSTARKQTHHAMQDSGSKLFLR